MAERDSDLGEETRMSMKQKKKEIAVEVMPQEEPNPVNEALAAPPKLGFFERLFKKQDSVFITLIIQQASVTLEGLNALTAYMENQTQANAALLTAKEKEADEVRRILINELNKTFITPFDREDIFTLSRTIDDVLDYAYSTVTEMEIFKVKPAAHMLTMAGLLRDAVSEIHLAVLRMQQYKDVANEHVRRAKKLENSVEEVYRQALAEMFSNVDDVKQVVKVMKLREVYRHLSNAADRGDEAANVIADIIVKTM
jgi:predicted phosphate transport protein (TIGR00153 family)